MVNWNLSKHSFCWPVSCDHIVGSSSELTADQVLVVWKRVDTYPILKINQVIDFSLSNVFHCFCFVYFDVIQKSKQKTKQYTEILILYSTDQKKPNRERKHERERNGYRTGMRTGTERVQNGYRTDTEREWIKKRRKKAFSRTQTWNDDPWGIFCGQTTARNERGCSDIPH